MTLDQMNKYLEDRGFTVNRTRDTNKGVYVFYIMKDGIRMTGEYRWAQTKDWRLRDRDQMAFLQNLMREFHAKQSFNEVDTLYEKCLRDLTTFKEENEMNAIAYTRRDIEMTKDLYARRGMTIKDVIFNNPATIVFWMDGTKTVVKAENEPYDPEKGLAMAFAKRVLGNKGNYYNTFRKWLPEEGNRSIIADMPFDYLISELYKLGIKVDVELTPKNESSEEPVTETPARWKIWFQRYNEAGKEAGGGLHVRDYASKGAATRAAKRVFDNRPEGDPCTYEWIVSQTNPWTVKE